MIIAIPALILKNTNQQLNGIQRFVYVVVLMPYTRCCKSFKNTDKMEEYYFKTTGWDNGTCTEKCKVKDTGVMIGSVKCQQCEFCVEHQKPCE